MRTLVDYRPALRSRTGVGEYVHELAHALIRTGPTASGPPESLSLFSSSWADRLDPQVIPGATAVDCRWPVRLLNYTWHRWEWPAVEAITRADYDVVQSLHPLLIPTRRAAQVVTIHDLDFLDHPERTSGEIRRDYPALAASHARRADAVIAVSRFTAGEVERRLGVPASQIAICSPGAPPWLPRDHDPDDGYVLFLGSLEPRKNVGVLLDAYARLASSRADLPKLVLAGRPGEGSAPWIARTRTAPLAGRVEMPGYVAPDARRDLMAGALALVMPSLMEGFGIPALEAMTLGVPVIVSERGALPEVVGDAGLLFDPLAPDALAAALTRVIADAGLRRAMSERGLRRAAAYSWDHTAHRTREAWQAAVAAKARRG